MTSFAGANDAVVRRCLLHAADGQYVVCGSEDGSATMWDFATATPTPMPHMALGGASLHCMAWSTCFQAIAACSFSHYAPIRVLGWAAEQQQVVLNPPDPAAQKQYGQVRMARCLANSIPRYEPGFIST